MSKIVRTKLCATVTLVALLFALFAFFSMGGSTAWFAENKSVTAGGMQVNLASDGAKTATVTLYDVSSVTSDSAGDVSSIVFSGTAVNTPMQTYSLLETATHYKLMKISFDADGATEIDLSVTTEATCFMDANHPLLADDGSGMSSCGKPDHSYQNSMSSIVSFLAVTATLSDGSYTVTPTGTPVTMVNSDDTMKTGPIPIVTDGSGSEIFILIAYDGDLINRVFGENIGNSVISNMGDNVSIPYQMDFTFSLSVGA